VIAGGMEIRECSVERMILDPERNLIPEARNGIQRDGNITASRDLSFSIAGDRRPD
jgi:hypothetical protein